MSSSINTILTIPVFGFLYLYTAAGILIVIILSWMKAKGIVHFLQKYWPTSVFLVKKL